MIHFGCVCGKQVEQGIENQNGSTLHKNNDTALERADHMYHNSYCFS